MDEIKAILIEKEKHLKYLISNSKGLIRISHEIELTSLKDTWARISEVHVLKENAGVGTPLATTEGEKRPIIGESGESSVGHPAVAVIGIDGKTYRAIVGQFWIIEELDMFGTGTGKYFVESDTHSGIEITPEEAKRISSFANLLAPSKEKEKEKS
jgi:hypothetical protein